MTPGSARRVWAVDLAMIRRRIAHAALAGLAGAVVGIELADGEFVSLLAAALLLLALVRMVMAVAPHSEGRRLIAIVAVAVAIRLAVAVIVRDVSVTLGQDGTLMSDDHDYFSVAWGLAQYLHGGRDAFCFPPDWCGGAYLFGTFVYFESAVMFVFGRDLLLLETINAFLGAGLVIVVWDIARRTLGMRSAYASAMTVAVYPGLVLYSALNVKDPLMAFLTAVVLWLIVRFQDNARWWSLAAAYVVLEPVHGLRWYVFFILAVLIPLAVALTRDLTLHRVIRWTCVSIALSLGIIGFNAVAQVSLLVDDPLTTFESIRSAMSHGRTGFVPTAPPVAVTTPTRVATSVPTIRATSRQTTIPVAGGTPRLTTQPTVEPTTIVTLIPTPAESAPASSPQPESLVLTRTLAHLPRGVSYALFAPFPWHVEQLADVAVIPDTIFWYLILGSAVWTVVKRRREWRRFALLAGFSVVMLAVFTLLEGNIGTLYRHRTITVVPFLAVLAGPTLAAMAARVRDVIRGGAFASRRE